MPVLSALVGAIALFIVTALLGAPNAGLAIAFFVAFFAASGLHALMRGRASPDRSWRMRSFGAPAPEFAGGATVTPLRRSYGANVEPPRTGSPFNRFTDRSKRVLALAQDEAIRFNHNYIGTEHLLLGLVREGEGVAARVLNAMGVELSTVRKTLEFTVGRGESTTSPSEITLSPRTKKVIELANDEASRLGHSHVGTEHLLLGLVREGEGIASGMLESLGLSLDRVRYQVIATLGQPQMHSGPQSRPAVPPIPIERLSEEARRLLPAGLMEAARRKSEFAGTEHLLLALAAEGAGAAGRALADAGVDAERITKAVDLISERGETEARRIVWSPRAIAAFQLAVQEAGERPAGTGHVLLGVLREGEGMASGILASLGVPRDQLEKIVREKIAEGLP
jgi:ATP-dependent Clp protease ATP-binding subunit ClpA